MRESIPRFVQGIFEFTGAGYEAPAPIAGHSVSDDRRAQMVYLRAGNSSADLAIVSISRDGLPMRLFPVGAKAALHVPLAVVEDIEPGTRLELAVAAPPGATGTIVVDLGLVEI